MRDNTITNGQRVHHDIYGDGEAYSLLYGGVWVKFDNGNEDRYYTRGGAAHHLSLVTPPLSFPPSPASCVNDLYAVVTAMSECDDTEECEECIAFAVCNAACRMSTFDRQQLAAALLGVTS